ncbi:PilZ domain-containing protein [Aromatoleum sp.]|uniref:PilZ domain-containing protein n=1 Tax=Aromatoleum sp. TaxID=2307007 RepID=UPI002FCA5BB8
MQDEQSHPAQRRLYSRIPFRTTATFLVDGAAVDCELRDLSLKGALVQPDDLSPPAPGQRCALELRLDDGESVIRMGGSVAHAGHGRVGIVCREIDLDSLTHLRRLLELNLGDSEMLHVELSALRSA